MAEYSNTRANFYILMLGIFHGIMSITYFLFCEIDKSKASSFRSGTLENP